MTTLDQRLDRFSQRLRQLGAMTIVIDGGSILLVIGDASPERRFYVRQLQGLMRRRRDAREIVEDLDPIYWGD